METVYNQPPAAPPTPIEESPALARKRKSQGRIIVERFLRNRASVAALIFLVIVGFIAVFAPILTHASATYDPPNAVDVHAILQGPSAAHLLGTDDVGRDEVARLIFGGRVSLTVGVVVSLASSIIGIIVGALAGYYGGWVDVIMMRITDVFLSIPLLLVLLLLSVSFSDGSVSSIIVLIAIFEWPVVARIVRGEFLSLKEREFLLAARTLGAKDWRLIVRHILPNAAGPILVAATLIVSDAVILEATISFFGYGIQPPTPSWGNMVNDSQSYITTLPILLFAPGVAILLSVLSFNLLGDGLRDALDPYMTQR